MRNMAPDQVSETHLRDIALHCICDMPHTRPQFERVMAMLEELWEWRARVAPNVEPSDVVVQISAGPPRP
jgi:hypothetical protein